MVPNAADVMLLKQVTLQLGWFGLIPFELLGHFLLGQGSLPS